jgi:hypothetical protein
MNEIIHKFLHYPPIKKQLAVFSTVKLLFDSILQLPCTRHSEIFSNQAGVDGSRTHCGLLRNPPAILKTARPTGTEPPPDNM